MSFIHEQKLLGLLGICKAIQAISHMGAHSKKAIRWLEWLLRKQATIYLGRLCICPLSHQARCILQQHTSGLPGGF